jgi:hypothetical protein
MLSDLRYLIDKGLAYFKRYKRDRRLSPDNQMERISALNALEMASNVAKRVHDRFLDDPAPLASSRMAELLLECRSTLATAVENIEAIVEATVPEEPRGVEHPDVEGGELRITSTFSVGSEDWAAAANQGSPCYRPTSP